jgi:hypothetical protein
MDEIIIKLSASDDGYHYYIYAGDDAYMECDESDGGICTSTMGNALEMAFEDTKRLLRA